MKRPWNLIDAPVYSLLTCKEGRTNMNICTYVTAVSMQPKQFAVAVFHGSYTQSQVTVGTPVVLQLLAEGQHGLVRHLGKQSGYILDKHAYLLRKNQLKDWQGFDVLREAVAWMVLQPLSMQAAGDHDVWLMEVQRFKVNREVAPLTLSELRRRKLVRA
jgi:flavin reductase (DIM6/NTAB) family NADH-FMN oxidoreductase RutF